MKSMISGLRDPRAFSLVELLLYVGILGIVGGLLTGILTTATKTQVQQASQDKLSGELSFAMQTIQRLVQSSSLIDMDTGTTSSSLKLRTEALAQDPTLVYLSGGTIYIQQGSSTPQALTDGAVSVSSLQFQKFSQYPGKDVVQIDIAMNDAAQPNALARSLRSAVSRASAATFDSPLLPGSNTYSIGTTGSPWSNGYFSGTLGIASGGLLGIGTLTPSYPLDLEVPNNGIFVSSTATTSNYSLLNLQAGTTTAFYVRNDGNIGIGTSTPAYGLDIYGTFHVSSTATFDGNIVFGGATPTYRISNVATPATSTDVATKGYVDGLTAGGGIPSGYGILGSATSTTPSGYSFASNLLGANMPYWNKMASLPYTQYMQATTVGLDGIIYSIGGYVNGSISGAMFAYDPTAGTWSQKASVPYTTYYSTAATGPDGLIYLFGGYANGSPTSTIETYNPSTNSWSKNSATLLYTGYYNMAVTGLDGLIYVMGGMLNSAQTSTVRAFNTSSGTWTTKASLPVATYLGTPVVGSNGLIYLIGGMSLSNVEVYNPSTNTWAAKSALPYSNQTYYTGSAQGADGLIYTIGHASGTTTVQLYNTGADAWSTGPNPFPFVARMTPLETGPDGLIYSIGGTANSSATSTVFQYNQAVFKLYTKN